MIIVFNINPHAWAGLIDICKKCCYDISHYDLTLGQTIENHHRQLQNSKSLT